ncbi:unnamed protein product [Polarella glacialis]|uniref:Uncharacterized protein n=1 Tax=Polarella glacialis TaxID=89957 RepID=A0A813DF16_POLGL|nr:unnamed protein product [Polarella glacialis]
MLDVRLQERLNTEEQRRRDVSLLDMRTEHVLSDCELYLDYYSFDLSGYTRLLWRYLLRSGLVLQLVPREDKALFQVADAETLAAEREGQCRSQVEISLNRLRHLRQQLSGEEIERQDQEQQQEEKVREMRRQKSEALTQVAAKEAQVAELQRQVAEELSQRQAAQKQLSDKEYQLKEAKEQPSDRLSKQQAAQTQAIEIQREVCNLQQQLADELSKRQAVQYQIIDKDRVICELQASLAEFLTSNGLSSPHHRHREVKVHSEYYGDGGLAVAPHLDTIEERLSQSPVLGTRSISSDGYGSASSVSIPMSGSSMAGSASSRARMPPWLASPALGTRSAHQPSSGVVSRTSMGGPVTSAVSAGTAGAPMEPPPRWANQGVPGGGPPGGPPPLAPGRNPAAGIPPRGVASQINRIELATLQVAQQHGPMPSGMTAGATFSHSGPPAQTGGVMRQRAYGTTAAVPVPPGYYSHLPLNISRRLSHGSKTFS